MFLLFLHFFSMLVTIWLFFELIFPEKLVFRIRSKNTFDNIKLYMIVLFSLAIFLLFVFTITLSLLPIENRKGIEVTVIILGIISLFLFFALFLFIGINVFIKIIIWTIKNVISLNFAKSEENRSKLIKITGTILGIVIIPIILFAVVYSFSIAIFNSFEDFTNLSPVKYIYYSIAISYSLPHDEIIEWIQNEMSKNLILKVIPSIQVIIQKIIDIFLLGLIAALIGNTINEFNK